MVLREKLRMLLDERNKVVHLLLLHVEAALTVLRHDEFVATDTASVTAYADIRGIAQAVTLVQVIARVDKHVLDVQPLQEIVVCKFSFSHVVTFLFSCR